MKFAIAVIYILSMVSANILVWWLGPWFSPINSFILIGLDLTLRDVMHERISKWQMAAMIVIGGAITFLANPSAYQIALASSVAFVVSSMADWATYSKLRSYKWLVRSNGSNVVGAVVDSAIFPTLAFGAFMPHIIAMQFLAKVIGGSVWAYLLRKMIPK